MDSQAPQTPGSKNTTMITTIIIAIIVVIAGAYYYTQNGDDKKTASETTQTTTTDTATTPGGEEVVHSPEEWANGSVMDDGTKVFSLVGSDFSFAPNQIKVKKGDKVKVMLLAQDMPHDFVLEGYTGVKTKVIQPGNTDFVMFTADKAGTFTFYCSVGEHRAKGMVGQLMVTE
ncbi:MAG: cupredoxin domain-containing protein [Candidatus Doudnabacteria bacterium]|nr:cupredoxin domain-containing protein [Candidatus Doudnabacteria bacterium]